MKNLNISFKSRLILYFSFFLFLLPLISFAQAGGPSGPPGGPTGPTPDPSLKITIPNPLRSDINSIPQLVTVLITEVVVPVGGVIAVLMIMYGGFMYVTAAGDTTKIKKAHQTLLWACIGAAILLGADLLAHAINSTVSQLG